MATLGSNAAEFATLTCAAFDALPEDEKAKAARLRAQNALQQGGGRESTDLTDTANTSYLGT